MSLEAGQESLSKQRQTVRRWAAAVSALDVDAMAQTLSDRHYEHHFLPSSAANALGLPVFRDKGEYVEAFRELLSLLGNFTPEVHEVIETPGKVVVHLTGEGASATGHPFLSEWVVIYYLEEEADGEMRIVRVKEFLDSRVMVPFTEEERKRIKELKTPA